MRRLFESLLVVGIASLAAVSEAAAGEKPGAPIPSGANHHDWKQTGTSLALCKGGKTVWRLVADPQEPKSYFHPLATPDGEVLTAFRPADHPWHHGLWWSWKLINGLNYWEEDPATRQSEGTTELTAATFKPAADFSARAELSFSYHPPGQAPVMTELRQLSITAPDADGRYRIDWTSEFTAGNAPVTLGRTPPLGEEGGKGYGGYAGLSLRLVLQPDGWSVRTGGGQNSVATAHGKRARWVDFSKPGAGIAVLDHPGNLHHPSPWYLHDSAPMSYFSPAVLFNQPLVLPAGRKLKLCYRILIHSKPLTVEQIEAGFHDFAPPAKP